MSSTGKIFMVWSLMAMAWLVINLVLVPVHWNAVFHQPEITTGTEYFILTGFLCIILLDLSVIAWMMSRYISKKPRFRYQETIVPGAVCCLLLLVVAKVMADEVGRESRMDMEYLSEYIIFNILLGFQLLYFLVFMRIIGNLNQGLVRGSP
jgi:hypothetical protein